MRAWGVTSNATDHAVHESPLGITHPARLEAFSDGVFAIAITLLVLDVKVSGDPARTLAQQLRTAWPTYAAFVISFLLIGTMWINHHGMFRSLRGVDHPGIVANMALLLVVSFVPFPTKLVGENLRGTSFSDQRTAVLLYSATLVAISIVYPMLWWAMTRNRQLLRPEVTPAMIRAGMRRNALGLPLYSIVLVVAIWAPTLSLLLSGVLALFYLLPHRTPTGTAST